jgi:hypothetical protein
MRTNDSKMTDGGTINTIIDKRIESTMDNRGVQIAAKDLGTTHGNIYCLP